VLKIDLKMGEKIYKQNYIIYLCSLKIVCQKGFLHISGLINMEPSVECAQ